MIAVLNRDRNEVLRDSHRERPPPRYVVRDSGLGDAEEVTQTSLGEVVIGDELFKDFCFHCARNITYGIYWRQDPEYLESMNRRNTVASMKIGPVIRRARVAAKLTQADLGEILGWTDGQGRISHYERGRNPPDWDVLEEIAGAMGMTVLEMLERYGDETARHVPISDRTKPLSAAGLRALRSEIDRALAEQEDQ